MSDLVGNPEDRFSHNEAHIPCLQLDGIQALHEFHLWQLTGNRIIASAHIRCHDIQEYMTLASKVKQIFHDAGVHSTTIQPEFSDPVRAFSIRCFGLGSAVGRVSAPRQGGTRFDPGPRHTKVGNNVVNPHLALGFSG